MADKKQRMDAIMNRQHILSTATELFKRYSVSEVTMKQIAIESDVGQGTLYRHFCNKADICQNIVDSEIEDMFKKIENIMDSDNAYEVKIKHILYQFVELINKNKHYLEEMKQDGRRSRAIMNLHFYQRLKMVIQTCITQLDIAEKPEFHTDILLNSFSRDVFDYYCMENEMNVKIFADRICYIFVEQFMRI